MRNRLVLICIFFLAFFLRFYQLGSNPPSLDWDEAALGYNAYSILKSARDEYGNFLPLTFRSFGDYKPPLYVYLTVLPVKLLGLNEFAVRFPSAFFGSLSVIIGYFLIKKLFPNKTNILYLVFTLLFAVSPWHIQFSRVAFEANVALFFYICGVWLFIKSLDKSYFSFVSLLSFGLSLYTYHSPRLVIPALFIGLFLIFFEKIKANYKWYLCAFFLFLIFISPILWQLKSATGARFGSVTILNADERLGESIKNSQSDLKNDDYFGSLMHNRRVIFGRDILSGYIDHFNFNFLFLNGDAANRHHTYGMGMLYLWDFPFILMGLYLLAKNRDKGSMIVLCWFLVAPIASALTKATPHAVRALLYLPTYQIFSAYGLIALFIYLKSSSKPIITNFLRGLTLLLWIVNFSYYLHMYYIHTPKAYADAWQYGYKEVISEITNIEDQYQKIVFTYQYDQPYIFYLFYRQIDPVWYQSQWGGGEVLRDARAFGKYEFRKINWNIDSQGKNTLFVGTPKEIPENVTGLIKNIYFPDGSVAFRVVAR